MNIHKFPFVSILIAARNEQDNIIDCLSALEHLTWPKEKFEVLIGNDHSEDNTKTLVEDYIKDKSNFHLHDINNNSPPLPPSPSETEKRRNGETEKGGIGETEKRGRQVTDSSIHRFTDSGGGRCPVDIEPALRDGGLGFGGAGKSNVLAHLARKVKGDYFLTTDADIQIPENWIEEMLKGIKMQGSRESGWMHEQTCNHATMQPSKSIGIVTGVTLINGNNIFHHLQAIDWLFALGMIKALSELKIPVTAMGNNMLIVKKAYDDVGGYEYLPPSITEDFFLFRAITKKGWQFKNLFNTGVLVKSVPLSSIIELLHQRKRWMKGAMQLPFYLVCLLFIQALFYPVIVTALLTLKELITLPIFITIAASKFLLQSLFIALLLQKLKAKYLLKYLLIYEVYSSILSVTLLIFYFLPIKVRWKGRVYSA